VKNNLKPFRPGQSGNPNGRPKKIPLDDLLTEVCTKDEMIKVLKALLKKAKAGNTTAAQIILDRYYGRAKEFVEITDHLQPEGSFDLSLLNDDELRTLISLQEKIFSNGNGQNN
jgi:hypothetical protein